MPFFNGQASVPKLYPTYCSYPTNINVTNKTFSCNKQDPPKTVNPKASAKFLEIMNEFQSTEPVIISPEDVRINKFEINGEAVADKINTISITATNIGGLASTKTYKILIKNNGNQLFTFNLAQGLQPAQTASFNGNWLATTGTNKFTADILDGTTIISSKSINVIIDDVTEDPVDDPVTEPTTEVNFLNNSRNIITSDPLKLEAEIDLDPAQKLKT
jgi:hypothetical protein